MLSGQSAEIVVERARGDTLTSIAERYGISHQRVSAIFSEATEFVDKVELDLLVARKTRECCALIVPYGSGYQTALDFSDWLVGRLRGRDLDIRVETRRAHNGLALLLEDITNYEERLNRESR